MDMDFETFQSLNYATMATWLPKMPSVTPARKRCRRESKELQRWLRTLRLDRSENRRDVRQTLRGIEHNIRWKSINQE